MFQQIKALGGVFGAAFLLGGFILVTGLLPMAVGSRFSVEYQVEVTPTAGAQALPADTFIVNGISCHQDPSQQAASPGVSTLICVALEEADDDGLGQIASGLSAKGWVLSDSDFGMSLSHVPSLWVLSVVMLLYIGLGIALVRSTKAGWGMAAVRASPWKAALLVLLPIGLLLLGVSVVGALGWVELPSPPDLLLATAAGAHGFGIGMPLGAALFLLLPVLAALPEEALFRGWIHERLFERLPVWTAYLVTAQAFTVLHIGLLVALFAGDQRSPIALIQLVTVFGISLILTWIRRVGGAVVICVLAHAAYNTAIIAAHLYRG